jgi:hypothetical protein
VDRGGGPRIGLGLADRAELTPVGAATRPGATAVYVLYDQPRLALEDTGRRSSLGSHSTGPPSSLNTW